MTDSGGICDLQPFATLAFYAFMESDGQVVGFIRSGGIEVDDVIGNFVIDGGFSVYTDQSLQVLVRIEFFRQISADDGWGIVVCFDIQDREVVNAGYFNIGFFSVSDFFRKLQFQDFSISTFE